MGSTGKLIVRNATPEDLPSILQLVQEPVVFTPGRKREDWLKLQADLDAIRAPVLEMVEHESSAVIVGSVDESVVAFIYVRSVLDVESRRTHGHVAELVVLNDAYETEIGTLLLENAESWAKRRGFAHLTISVNEPAANAVRFYEGFGFRRQQVRLLKPL